MRRLFHILAALSLCGGVFAGCFASKEEKMRHRALPFYNDALDQFLNGQIPLARDKVLLAIDKYPRFVEAHILYQRIRAASRETKELLREYRKLMRQNPSDPLYIFLYARLLDDLDEQERLYRKAIDLDKDFAWGYFGLGWVYYKRQRYSDAAEHFEQAVKLDPQNPIFHLNLGATYYLMKHNYDAESELRRAVELCPRLVSGWLDLATVYYQRADFPKAVEALNKYINLYPAAPDRDRVERLILQLNGGRL